MDWKVNYIWLAWKLTYMLKTYRTCNSTVRFSKYEFYNKLLDDVILLRVTLGVTWTQRYIYICVCVCVYIYICIDTRTYTHAYDFPLPTYLKKKKITFYVFQKAKSSKALLCGSSFFPFSLSIIRLEKV